MIDDVASMTIMRCGEHALARHLDAFGELLHACVHDGASIGFVLPFGRDDAGVFWRHRVMPGVRDGSVLLFMAERRGRLVGTVQLAIDTPPNQPHRAEARKLLVHPDHRRAGIGRALMTALEQAALEHGRTLITLDTRTGDGAEPLYASLGYVTVGQIPGYCRDPFQDRLDGTTIMYKAL